MEGLPPHLKTNHLFETLSVLSAWTQTSSGRNETELFCYFSSIQSPKRKTLHKQTDALCGPWLLNRGTSKNAVLPVKTIGEMGNWEPEITGVGDWAYTLRLPSLPSERKKHSCMPYKWKAQKTRPVPFCAYWSPSDREHRGRPQWHTIPLNWQHTEW